MIKAKNITKLFGRHKALDNVSLTINPGEIVSLLGVNGAGKTTLSSIVASLHPATEGDVEFEGASIYDDIISYRMHIGFCAQKQNLSENFTVRDHLIFGGRYYLMQANLLKQRVEELLDIFELRSYANKSAAILSGGYKQRLLIARAIIHKPKLIIMDEPTVALDPNIRRQLWQIILDLKKQNVAVLLTTHYLDEAEVLSDRICVLHNGRVKLIDTPQALMSSYNKMRLEEVFLELVQEETKKS